ncbi:MAG: hypothetical protein WBM32_03615 [Crocosphaera sp.]|jgi:hypothetical protein
MTLPDNFNAYEHLQDVVRKTHNREVRDAFSDLGDDEWLPDINTPRGSLRQACTIDDKDTASMILMRQNLFFLTLRKAKDYQADIIGTPKGNVDSTRQYRPQIVFSFKEDSGNIEEGYDPVVGRLSFRLMDETSTSITNNKLQQLANKIKLEFGSNNGYVWKKGKKYYAYTDKAKGYQLQILAINENEAKDLIRKVLAIQNHVLEEKRLTTNTNADQAEAYPIIPPNINILNEVQREPRKRPVANVRFQHAVCNIWGKQKIVPLYDRSFTFLNALETSF